MVGLVRVETDSRCIAAANHRLGLVVRIGIDLDGCAYPFSEEFTPYAAKRLGVEKLPPIYDWEFHSSQWALSDEQLNDLIADAFLEQQVWHSAAPYTGFAEALWKLDEAGHTIVICSNRGIRSDIERSAKLVTAKWLLDNRVPYNELILSADKRDADADIFIDDRPQAIPTLRLAGVDAVYMHRKWNQEYPYPRVHDWEEFVQYVEDRNV